MIMKRYCLQLILLFLPIFSFAREFEKIPVDWKWNADGTYELKYDGRFTDPKYNPIDEPGARNVTFSPDSSSVAYTLDNDLYVCSLADRKVRRLTFDGSDLILNGWASWVYYEEIFGRASRYKAFWWSPDGKKIAYYRFDNTNVPLFPIYSPFAKGERPEFTDLGLGGSLNQTRYPKAGQENPQVRIGIIDLEAEELRTVWADFNPSDDQYFGTPFWSDDSKGFYVSRMPRLQNTLDLYRVDSENGSKEQIYHETYPTWIDWMDNVVFTSEGLYMVRNFETDWQQIYFLSYDGKTFRRLTEGTNWSVSVLRVDAGDVYFTAKRDATIRQALYKVDRKGRIYALTDPAYNVSNVKFSPDGKKFICAYSNFTTPTRVAVFSTRGGILSSGHGEDIITANLCQPTGRLEGEIIADSRGEDYNPASYGKYELVHITTSDGFTLPGLIQYPLDFDSSRSYPVHVDIYGGPDAPQVRDRWVTPNDNNQWYSRNGIIQITVDPRDAGHNGRKGMDMIYKQLTVHEVEDFVQWGRWLQSLPYVNGAKIGVEGFSFGGTMTSMLLMKAPDVYHYGIAGGGVYDWALYDSHYTERFMDTPERNPEGYEAGRVLSYVELYPVNAGCENGDVMLKITHGTADDNVHFQNTLQLVDALEQCGKCFEFMIYPDGMHGYSGRQWDHFNNSNRAFWLKYLKD